MPGDRCRCALAKWRTLRRHVRQSAFDGYQQKWSPYSDVICLSCGACWRTKAAYVEGLYDVSALERENWLKGIGYGQGG